MIVQSEACPLKTLFAEKFDLDFFQREYVWQSKDIEELVRDLSNAFFENYQDGDALTKVSGYNPYYMGEVVLSQKSGKPSSIIDGQQRITTLTLFLIYLTQQYGGYPDFPKEDVRPLVYSNYFGTMRFNLDIPERKSCMDALFKHGDYTVKAHEPAYLQNIVDRYHDFEEFWDKETFNEHNVIHFVYWLMEHVIFSKVWTDSDDFAYVIFETMNDRGEPLTAVEMLRSYLLANVDEQKRTSAKAIFDDVVNRLRSVKLNFSSKAEFEFFKIYFRGHYSEDSPQSKSAHSDFIRIGKGFHRWVKDDSAKLNLNSPSDYMDFLERIDYFSRAYRKINALIQSQDTDSYLYLIVNNDFNFTLQSALILASICYNDSDNVMESKIRTVSKYLSKVLAWKVWNHQTIAQSSLEVPIYGLCKKIRGMSASQLDAFLKTDPIPLSPLNSAPMLNQQNKRKLKVLLALITEIVARGSAESAYLLKGKGGSKIEVEHIWSDDYSEHTDEFRSKSEFENARNGIGGLLLLPKGFNASYGAMPYEEKVEQYFAQNILAQTLNAKKYQNNPGFMQFKANSGLPFKPYNSFTRSAVEERAELYKAILLWNWK